MGAELLQRLTVTRQRLKSGRPGEADDHFAAEAADRAEARLLNLFWQLVRQDGDRLGLLLDFGHLVVKRAGSWDAGAVREAHEQRRALSPNVTLTRKRCFSCEADAVLYEHHIIEIQNGGSNALRNRVPLCFDCHQYLHPWLTDDDRAPAPRKTGFESVGEVMARLDIEDLTR